MPNPHLNSLLDQLWPRNQRRWVKVCAVLDGARDERIFRALEASSLEKSCLYAGRLPTVIQEVAPHLVVLERDDKFTRYLLEEGWGNSWGIFFRAEVPVPVLARHFRTFLKVKDYTGKSLIFRWYDPRVLRVYLPTCLPDELKTVFGPVETFYLEAENPSYILEYNIHANQLVETATVLSDATLEKRI